MNQCCKGKQAPQFQLQNLNENKTEQNKKFYMVFLYLIQGQTYID